MRWEATDGHFHKGEAMNQATKTLQELASMLQVAFWDRYRFKYHTVHILGVLTAGMTDSEAIQMGRQALNGNPCFSLRFRDLLDQAMNTDPPRMSWSEKLLIYESGIDSLVSFLLEDDEFFESVSDEDRAETERKVISESVKIADRIVRQSEDDIKAERKAGE